MNANKIESESEQIWLEYDPELIDGGWCWLIW